MKALYGFTLIEILVVMVIIGMTAAVVIPRISGGQVTLLQVQVREAVAVLKYARRSAIVEGKQKTVIFHEGKKQAEKKPFIQPGHWTSRGASLQWGDDTDNEEKTDYKVTFYPEGGSSGGELILNYLEYKATININPLTGKIKSEIMDDKHD